MSKMKRLSKININITNQIGAIYVNYFVSLGLNVEPIYSLGCEGSAAAFLIKFGNNEYRRTAWLSVCDEVKKLVSDTVYSTLNGHFANGSAEHFTSAFDYKTRLQLKARIH